jgi:sec-independent protein translocase protein TatB
MFDVGFSELIVIGIVALVVIGPERLPKVARTAGLLLGRLQRYVGDVKADIAREMQLDELKKLQSEMKDSMAQLETTVTTELRAVEESVEQSTQSARAAIEDLSASFAETTREVDAELERTRNEALAAAASLPEQTQAEAVSELTSLAPAKVPASTPGPTETSDAALPPPAKA